MRVVCNVVLCVVCYMLNAAGCLLFVCCVLRVECVC